MNVPAFAAFCGHDPGTCCMYTPYVVFGAPFCSWISAWNEPVVSFSTTYPTGVVASLVFVVQSPTAGLFVPSTSLWPPPGTVVEGDVLEVVEGVVLEVVGGEADGDGLEQAGRKTKVATSTTEAATIDRRGNLARILDIVRSGMGAN